MGQNTCQRLTLVKYHRSVFHDVSRVHMARYFRAAKPSCYSALKTAMSIFSPTCAEQYYPEHCTNFGGVILAAISSYNLPERERMLYTSLLRQQSNLPPPTPVHINPLKITIYVVVLKRPSSLRPARMASEPSKLERFVRVLAMHVYMYIIYTSWLVAERLSARLMIAD